MKGLLNYSRVAQYTEKHFGGPKAQSILNNDKHRLYIQLRMQEYNENKRRSKPPHLQIPNLNILALI